MVSLDGLRSIGHRTAAMARIGRRGQCRARLNSLDEAAFNPLSDVERRGARLSVKTLMAAVVARFTQLWQDSCHSDPRPRPRAYGGEDMKRPAVWLSLVVLSLAFGGAARAEVRTQVDRGLLLRSGDGESFAAPIVGTAVAVRVTGIVARSRATQVFLNPTTAWVEGIYVFPLPEGAVVDALRMTIGDRVLSGVVREKRQAVAVYRQA